MADSTLTDAAYRRGGELYRVYAFVCSQTCVKRTDRDPPPTATFTQIYQQRPNDCRFAVAGHWIASTQAQPFGGERYFVWDLYNVLKNSDGDLITPKPRLVHDHLEAAIMATVLMYNKEMP